MVQGVEERIQQKELTAEAKDRLIQWLRDAHAMEMQAETMLSQQAERMENYRDLQSALNDHRTQTMHQAERVEQCINRLGGEVSGVKDMAAKGVASLQSIGGVFTTDEIVKGAMASYLFEHFEISAYRALCAAADELGDEETASICTQILKEEEEMAARLEKLLDECTRAFLRREQRGAHAKN